MSEFSRASSTLVDFKYEQLFMERDQDAYSPHAELELFTGKNKSISDAGVVEFPTGLNTHTNIRMPFAVSTSFSPAGYNRHGQMTTLNRNSNPVKNLLDFNQIDTI